MSNPDADTIASPAEGKLELTPRQKASFWKRVDKRGPDECWIWTGSKMSGTAKFLYGKFYLSKRSFASTHRISFQMHHRILLPGECALHRCDVPLCVNPAHLFAGTKGDNNRDRDAKGRTRFCDPLNHWSKINPEKVQRGDAHYARRVPGVRAGEKNGRARLKASDVTSIRELFAIGCRVSEIGLWTGMNPGTIGQMISGRLWRHVKS